MGCDRTQERGNKMTTLRINTKNNTIEMPSKKYEKLASKFGSKEYKEVQAARADYPNFTVVTKKAPKRNDPLKGITYEKMEQYILTHDEDGEIMKEFKKLTGKSDDSVGKVSYSKVKSWFSKTYFPKDEETENVKEKTNDVQ